MYWNNSNYYINWQVIPFDYNDSIKDLKISIKLFYMDDMISWHFEKNLLLKEIYS